MRGPRPEWLSTTLGAVRDVILKRLETGDLDADAEKDMHMALEELDVMWEELQGQAELLERENERYAEFFEHAPDAYVITDAGGNVREANQAALELLGVQKAAVIGQPLSEFIPEGERVAFLAKFVGMFLNPDDKAQSWRSAVRPAQGEPRPATISVRRMPLKKSGVRGLCWLIRTL